MNTTFVSSLDTLARPVSPKSVTIASSFKAKILAIGWRTVLSSLTGKAKFMGRVLKDGCSSDTSLSSIASNVSSPSALGIGVATSGNAALGD